MKANGWKRVLALGLLLPLLSGCSASLLKERSEEGAALPAMKEGPDAPTGDTQTPRAVSVVLYLPDFVRGRLVSVVETVNVEAGQNLQEAVVQRLLERISPSFPSLNGQRLRLLPVTNAVEISNGLVTLNLSVLTRLLNYKEQFTLRMAITNTLTELPGVLYVSVLVNGRDDGLDLAATVPNGVLSRYPSSDIDAFWSQAETQASQMNAVSSFSKSAALYFVTADGTLLLPEVRNVVFSSRNQASMVETLLDEMAKGSQVLSGIRKIIPPKEYRDLNAPPEILVHQGTSYKLVKISFIQELSDYLTVMGGSYGMLAASLCYTLTSFLPGLDGVVISIGGKDLTQMQDLSGQSLSLDNGWLSRADFDTGIASDSCLYFPTQNGEGLAAVRRPVDQRLASQPRNLLRQLLRGPTAFDRDDSLVNAFPADLTDADVLGIAMDGDLMQINLSDAFARACATLPFQEGRNMIYSIVNTMTELAGVRRIRFYVEGRQWDFMRNGLSTRGEFLRHPGLILH